MADFIDNWYPLIPLQTYRVDKETRSFQMDQGPSSGTARFRPGRTVTKQVRRRPQTLDLCEQDTFIQNLIAAFLV